MSSLTSAEAKTRRQDAAPGGDLRRRVLALTGKGATYLFLLAMALIELLPILWLFSTSLRPAERTFDLPPDFFPTSFRWRNYLAVFNPSGFVVEAWRSDLNFPLYFLNSFKVAVAVTVGQLLSCSMAAFAYARLRFRGKGAIFLLFLASMMVPTTTVVVPYFIIVRTLGLVDTHWALILPGLTSAFGVFLLRQHFKALPYELSDAAKIDGASHFRIYWNILLPMVGPALASLGIFTFLASWNEFYFASLFIRTWDKYTLPLGLVILAGPWASMSLPVLLAAVFTSILPVLVVFLLAQNFVIDTMARSGVRG